MFRNQAHSIRAIKDSDQSVLLVGQLLVSNELTILVKQVDTGDIKKQQYYYAVDPLLNLTGSNFNVFANCVGVQNTKDQTDVEKQNYEEIAIVDAAVQ